MNRNAVAGGAAPQRLRHGGRRPAVAATTACILLAAACAALVVVETPWSPLGARVPGGAVRPDPRLDFDPAEIAREHAYHAAVHPPAYLSLGVGLLVAALLGFTPAGTSAVAAVSRLAGAGWVRAAAIATVAFVLAGRLCTMPFDAWAQSVQRRYGLSTQDWGGWVVDQAKGLAVTLVITVPVVLLAYALARRLVDWWWAPLAAVGAGLVMLVSFVYPLVVEPVFANFHPLAPGPLRSSLLALAHEDGLRVDRVLVADASRRTTTLNAYVSGYGASRRIVLYDTLLREPAADIRLVVAHELGHAKFDDVLHGTIEGALGFGAGVCGCYLLLRSRRLLRLADATAAGDPRTVPLVLGLVVWLTFAASPMQNLVSRHIEARADVHSLDLTREPVAFVSAHHALAVRGLSTLRPNPVLYALFFDHPSEPERIALARDWARIHGAPEPPPLVRPPAATSSR
jgi:STE24 endopeptidase